MPKQSLDVQHTLEIMVSLLVTEFSHDILLHDPCLLIREVKARKFDWEGAAMLLGITKSRLYHWFRETYQKNLKV